MIAIIPARKGSKRIPRKNLVSLNGKPLIQHTIEQALKVKSIKGVFIDTDDDQIKKLVLKMTSKKIWVMKRPDWLAHDYITTEKVLFHTMGVIEKSYKRSKYVILMQCTSPFRKPGDIDKALRKMKKEKADSLYFGYPIERWLWKDNKPINYNYKNRPMTQDKKWDILVECGDYIFTWNLFMKKKCRLGGKITHYEVDKKSAIDIDNFDDLEIARSLI